MRKNRFSIAVCCALILAFLSGCKGKTDDMLRAGNEEFLRGEALKASEFFLSVFSNDPQNITALIRLTSAGAYMNSDYNAFYENIKRMGSINGDFASPIHFTKAEANSNRELQKMVIKSNETMGQKVDNKLVSEEIEALTAAVKNNPGNPYFLFVRGLWNMQFFNFRDAQDDFNKAIELKKDFWQAIYIRGCLYNRINFWKANDNTFKDQMKAVNDLNRAAALNKPLPKSDEMLYLIYTENGNRNEALNCLNRLYEADTTRTIWLDKKAGLESEIGEHKKSAEDYKLLSQKSQRRGFFIFQAGMENMAAGNKTEGIENLKAALTQCSSERMEREIIRTLEAEPAKAVYGKSFSADKNTNEFLRLYLSSVAKIKEGKTDEGIMLLKKAEPLAINRYFRERVVTKIRGEQRKIYNRDRKTIQTKQERSYYKDLYDTGKEKLAQRNYKEAVVYLKEAYQKCKNGEEKAEIKRLLSKANSSAKREELGKKSQKAK